DDSSNTQAPRGRCDFGSPLRRAADTARRRRSCTHADRVAGGRNRGPCRERQRQRALAPDSAAGSRSPDSPAAGSLAESARAQCREARCQRRALARTFDLGLTRPPLRVLSLQSLCGTGGLMPKAKRLATVGMVGALLAGPAQAQRRTRLSLAFALGFAVLAAAPAVAGLTEVEIRSRAVVADGIEFGTVGPYEKIAGRFHFSIDPSDPANRAIRDIAHAPVTRRGLVEFSADFYLLKPVAIERGNGVLLFEVPNRGGKGILPMFAGARSTRDPTAISYFGD